MFPIGDENPTRAVPIVNRALIAINIVVFLLEVLFGDSFILAWSFIPERFTAFLQGNSDAGVLVTVLTAMFLHAGIAHIIGNMLFLWIYGDNVEDAFGHGRYLLFYLLCGVAATALQYYFDPRSSIPNLGASGAISGVMGAYVLMYPWARVRVFFFPFSLFLGTFGIPALLLVGFWFIMQLSSGYQSLGMLREGGVAYWAHVGGFVAGFLLALIWPRQRRRRQIPAYYGMNR
jgi:membrane associated rhomboid family serine protease